ncbi:protein-glutamate methylesterase/protein-glutamine glutaminase [Salinispira pacifica]|uniref:Protein-glutamate methylesterase/protein-glutamine glutaminase n=1 Tax=Salinispira pacifica TaxID=1307761 RepID=V5WJW8_9SPIO|nr:chemotaxis response regulator protein-glutamate methylesterase [Salinispira pacifica]AHC15884.1 Chemotaxis response regulator protein-glutamate methylesterase CheB [Salinispira pacifica]
MSRIRVLVVDDSAMARQIIEKGLSSDPEIEIVGTAADVFQARDLIVYREPDVITLDVEMPKMDGVEFLRRFMPQKPVPVVMVSAMTGPGARITLEALEYGAVDFVLKPSTSFGVGLKEMIDTLIDKVKAASRVDVSSWKNRKVQAPAGSRQRVLVGGTDKILAMGASTGGTVALRQILQAFPADMPGTVIVQHMPPTFTRMFAEKLDEVCKVNVKEAADGDRILRGQVLVAPGARHMEVKRSGGRYEVRLSQGEKVNGHIPSADVLFNSLASSAGGNVLGVILTGMGGDGARGLLEIRKAGGRTLGQDRDSSVVYGMPQVAMELGAVEKQLPLHLMVDGIIQSFQEMQKAEK